MQLKSPQEGAFAKGQAPKFNRRGCFPRMGKRSMCPLCGSVTPLPVGTQCPKCGQREVEDVSHDDTLLDIKEEKSGG